MTAAQAAVERLRAARDEVTGLSFDALTVPELLNLLGELESDRRRQPSVEHRLIQTLRNRAEPDNRLIERVAGPRESAKTAARNGFRHRT